MKSLDELVAGLPRRIEPPRDLWPEVVRTAGRRRTLLRLSTASAALAALVLAAAGLAVVVGGPRREALGRFADAEAEYGRSRRELVVALEKLRGALDPATVDLVLRDLDLVDVELRAARAALSRAPEDTGLAMLLSRTYLRAIAVVDGTAHLAARAAGPSVD